MNFQVFNLVLEKAEEPEIKLPTTAGSLKKQKNSRKKKIYFCFIDYAKAFDCVDQNKLWKILQEMGMKTHPLLFCSYCWVFQICWPIKYSTLTSSPFRIWNSSTGIPSPPLALFIVMLIRPTWLQTPGCLALDEWSHHHDYLGYEDLFCIVLMCILVTS